MKTKILNPKASIIIVNYNNAKYLKKSINSILNQSYKNKEIILVDDKSEDNSLDIIKKYNKKIKIIVNKIKTKEGSFNQINSCYRGFKKSKGEYIFFLDSDDYFKKDKLKILIKKFESNKSLNLIFDLPIFKFKNLQIKKKFRQKNLFFSSWPRFSPQSCITVRKKFAKEIFRNLRIRKYETVWLDFRIAVFHFFKKKNIYVLKKHLTYYRQLNNSASKKFVTFNRNWWYRRNQAHDFVTYLKKRLKLKDKNNLDKMITKIINYFL